MRQGMCWRRTLAERISRVANPLVIAAVAFISVITRQEVRGIGTILFVCLTFGVFLPFVYVKFLLFRKKINSFFIPQKGQRLFPLLVVSTSCLMGTVLLGWISAPLEVWALMFCYAVNAILMSIITFQWKVSLHASGAWGSLGAMVFLFGSFALLLVPFPLVISWARVEMGAHTKAQVFWGGGISLIATWLHFSLVLGGLSF